MPGPFNIKSSMKGKADVSEEDVGSEIRKGTVSDIRAALKSGDDDALYRALSRFVKAMRSDEDDDTED